MPHILTASFHFHCRVPSSLLDFSLSGPQSPGSIKQSIEEWNITLVVMRGILMLLVKLQNETKRHLMINKLTDSSQDAMADFTLQEVRMHVLVSRSVGHNGVCLTD